MLCKFATSATKIECSHYNQHDKTKKKLKILIIINNFFYTASEQFTMTNTLHYKRYDVTK